MRFFTAREGCKGGGDLGVMPGPDRVVMMVSLALVLDMDCARRLRAGGGDSGGDEAVPKSELVNVTTFGELGK
jgi:hypothetical protein